MPQITTSYVKFVRGTPAQWATLSTKDPNTLYFISEVDATSGLLYLGSKLIAGGVSGSSSLSELSDVVIGAGITTNSLLVYNGTTGKWENKSLHDVLASLISVMTGATSEQAGTSGLVPAPQAGDQNKFLKGDGTWKEVPDVADITALQASIELLIGSDTNKSIREIAASEVAKVVADAPASLDTLKEIADWIENHPDDITDLSSRVAALESQMTTVEGDITTINSSITSLTGDVTSLAGRMTTAETTIVEIDGRLRWWSLESND